MSEPLPPWLANLDPRFVRPDWQKWLRPDWQRWMPPGYDSTAQPAPRSDFARLYKPYRDEPTDPPSRRATGLTEADILFFRSNLAAGASGQRFIGNAAGGAGADGPGRRATDPSAP